MEQRPIKKVAIYLRKSRGDPENALENHEFALTRLCKDRHWEYTKYKEIKSGDSIEMRPIFQDLLEKVKNGCYDAVCVLAIDRLGRGDEEDRGKIKKIFKYTHTLVITPEKDYNLDNRSDEKLFESEGYFSRQEFSVILNRLVTGKKIGSQLGKWTNGTPPYPYEYEHWGNKYEKQGLVVNDDKLVVYRRMIRAVINDKKTPAEIAYELNKEGIPGPRGDNWYGNTVYRLLCDETHLGKIITNKSRGDGHKNKKTFAPQYIINSKDQWIRQDGRHEAVKTQDEHEKIMVFLSRLTTVPKRQPIRILPLSGLIKCGLCGHTMTLSFRNNRPKNPESIKPCWYHDLNGTKCKNRGMTISFIYDLINQEVLSYKETLLNKMEDVFLTRKREGIHKKIREQEHLLQGKEKTLERIYTAYENAEYSLKMFSERKSTVEKCISNIHEEIKVLQTEEKQYNSITIQDKINMLSKFQNAIQSQKHELLSDTQINKLYKSIVESIVWTRIGNSISIKVNFK